MNKVQTLEKITESGVVAVLRGTKLEQMIKIVEALQAGGIKAFEITLDNPDALEMIAELSAELEETDALVGAGTVLDGETARSAILAGAEFVFGPTLNQEMIEVCKRYGKVVIPGVLTPTEIINAYQAGADLVKLFPAGTMGSRYIKSVKGPLGHVPIMPTGGVNLDNVADFIEAGVEAVGAGSALLDKEAIAKEEYQVLTEKAENFIQIIEETRERIKH
ncbi:bifunctional 4-hydroxy-2-oxoglutarate aldolase/2-dehydro-3-deoxy-phosphogluconate aldolase [Halanaerocella petrolearia]